MHSLQNISVPDFINDEQKKQWLFENYALESNKFLSISLNWSERRISQIAYRNNLKKTKETMTNIRYYLIRKHQVNYDYFNNPTPDSCYILGFLTADGSIHHKTKSLVLGLKEEDNYILDYLRSEIGSNQPLARLKKIMNGKTFYGNSITFTHRALYFSLDKIGMSNPKREVDIFNSIPPEFKWQWLHGFFDGDGSCGLYNIKSRNVLIPSLSLCGMNYALLDAINTNLLKANVNIYCAKNKQLFTLHIGEHSILKRIYNMFYLQNTPKCFLSRKKLTMDKIYQYITRN